MADDQNSGDGGNAGGAADQGKTFTQAELDQIISDRLARAKPQTPADYAELQAKAQRLADIEAANATDLERAVKTARDEGRNEMLTTANARLVASEARALAAAAGFHDPADIVGLVNLSGIKVSEDGEVDSAAVKALVDAKAAASPYLVAVKNDGGQQQQVARRPKPDAGQGARAGDKPDDRETGRAEAERRFGKKS